KMIFILSAPASRRHERRMTNVECRMNDENRSAKSDPAIGHLNFGFPLSLVLGQWSLVIRISQPRPFHQTAHDFLGRKILARNLAGGAAVALIIAFHNVHGL